MLASACTRHALTHPMPHPRLHIERKLTMGKAKEPPTTHRSLVIRNMYSYTARFLDAHALALLRYVMPSL